MEELTVLLQTALFAAVIVLWGTSAIGECRFFYADRIKNEPVYKDFAVTRKSSPHLMENARSIVVKTVTMMARPIPSEHAFKYFTFQEDGYTTERIIP